MNNVKKITLGFLSIVIMCGIVFNIQSVMISDNDRQYAPIEKVFIVDEVKGVVDIDEPMVIQIAQPIVLSPNKSFVTTEFQHAGRLDDDTQKAFDLLIGDNIDALLDLIAQSNNNVLSTDSCKTCAIDAVFKKVSKHKKLSEQELVSLQHVIANLYKFINTMQKLSNKSIVAPEQFVALKNLNTSDVSQKSLIKQARQATTLAALQTLKNVDMVQRNG